MPGLIGFPRNVHQWAKAFNDDFGFEAWQESRPTQARPGSHEKIAVIMERLSRGQRLWHADDLTEGPFEYSVDDEGFRVKGTEESGAVVGSDREGATHRYGLWKHLGGTGPKMLYIPALAGKVDLFDVDEELSAILQHAKANSASLVIVASLYSVRVKSVVEMRSKEYPITSLGMLWVRWFAKFADRTVVCWGDVKTLDRSTDVLWMLGRTSKNCQIYAAAESGDPPPITKQSPYSLVKYDYRAIAEKRQREEDAAN